MNETTLTFLDAYCERAGDPAMWAEPLNALTNLFFIIAAYLSWQALSKKKTKGWLHVGDAWLLICALLAIGIGSGLWHLYATRATMLADVIPITVFINVYLLSAMRRILGLRWPVILGWWGVYWAVSIAAQKYLPPDTLNGSVMYLPTFATLIVLTAAIAKKHRAMGQEFVKILGIFGLSLIFRTLDLEICAAIPIGTHFLWHTLNAYMLYRLMRALLTKIR